jgi:uncharacterized protein RhaS with RHS repeats
VHGSGSWNRYAYVEGDPVNANDPSGLSSYYYYLHVWSAGQSAVTEEGGDSEPAGGGPITPVANAPASVAAASAPAPIAPKAAVESSAVVIATMAAPASSVQEQASSTSVALVEVEAAQLEAALIVDSGSKPTVVEQAVVSSVESELTSDAAWGFKSRAQYDPACVAKVEKAIYDARNRVFQEAGGRLIWTMTWDAIAGAAFGAWGGPEAALIGFFTGAAVGVTRELATIVRDAWYSRNTNLDWALEDACGGIKP